MDRHSCLLYSPFTFCPVWAFYFCSEAKKRFTGLLPVYKTGMTSGHLYHAFPRSQTSPSSWRNPLTFGEGLVVQTDSGLLCFSILRCAGVQTSVISCLYSLNWMPPVDTGRHCGISPWVPYIQCLCRLTQSLNSLFYPRLGRKEGSCLTLGLPVGILAWGAFLRAAIGLPLLFNPAKL